MAKDKVPRVLISKWPGRVSNRSPISDPQLALEANNVSMNISGQLSVRKGMRPVTFTNNQSSTAGADVISMVTLDRAEATWVVYEDSLGNIRAGKGPS